MSDEPFLSRWMRRKAIARQTGEAPAEPMPVTPAAVQPPVPETVSSKEAPPPVADPQPEQAEARELPAIDSLKGLASDYQDFMRAGVDDRTRGAALRKLFSDPHFNQMDGLDVYIDDYGIPDPIPSAMLAGLQQARSLLWAETQADAEVDATDRREPVAPPAMGASEQAGVTEKIFSDEDLDGEEGGNGDEPGEGRLRAE